MASRSTAPAQNSREKARQRVLEAAVTWVYDKSCSNALAELEEAVEALIGQPVNEPNSGRESAAEIQ